jgi:hypothetical protein
MAVVETVRGPSDTPVILQRGGVVDNPRCCIEVTK